MAYHALARVRACRRGAGARKVDCQREVELGGEVRVNWFGTRGVARVQRLAAAAAGLTERPVLGSLWLSVQPGMRAAQAELRPAARVEAGGRWWECWWESGTSRHILHEKQQELGGQIERVIT